MQRRYKNAVKQLSSEGKMPLNVQIIETDKNINKPKTKDKKNPDPVGKKEKRR
jgi:hypothetical protein